MGRESKIEWTDHTYNPWRGCKKVSPGCKNCYMYRDQKRYGHDPQKIIRATDKTFNGPLSWKEPALVFVCSWSDFFINEGDEWRDEAWDIIRKTPHLTYQILTKRPERIVECLPSSGLPKNVWLGVSAETQLMADERIPFLMQIEATVRFVSVEPMLEVITLNYYMDGMPEQSGGGGGGFVSREMALDAESPEMEGMSIPDEPEWRQTTRPLDWVICGGESGPGCRPMYLEWVEDLQYGCEDRKVPFFFKQWGGTTKKDGAWGGRELNGKFYNEMPVVHTPAPDLNI